MTNLCSETMRNCFTNLSNVFRKRTTQNHIENNHDDHDDGADTAESNVKIEQLTTKNNNNATIKSTTIACGGSEMENNGISGNDKKLLKLMIKNDATDKRKKTVNKSDQTTPSLAKSAEWQKEQQQPTNINTINKKSHKISNKKRNNDKNASMTDGNKMAKMLEAYREQQWWQRRQQEDTESVNNSNNKQIVMKNANDTSDKNESKSIAITIKTIAGDNDDVDVKIADSNSNKTIATTHDSVNDGDKKDDGNVLDANDNNDDDGDDDDDDDVNDYVDCINDNEDVDIKLSNHDKEASRLLTMSTVQQQQQQHLQQPQKTQHSNFSDSPLPFDSNISNPASEQSSYIDEYRSLVDEKYQVIRSYDKVDKTCNMEEALNLSSLRERAIAQSSRDNNLLHVDPVDAAATSRTSNAAAKTPEEIEYEAQVAAEGADVMTPLPSSLSVSNSKHQFPLVVGRNVQPEIAEVIRNLDAHALRINNLTLDDKLELMRRFEVSSAHQHQHSSKRHTYSRKHHRHNQHVDLKRLTSDGDGRQHGGSVDVVDSSAVDTFTSLLGADYENEEAVVLRKKQPVGLFARRQPLSPKLRLQVPHSHDEEDDAAERNLIDLKYPTVLPPNPQLKALLIFHKWDNISEVLTEACHRQQMEVTMVKTKEAALETLQSNNMSGECFHLIIIDARSCKHLDAEYITRSIRHTNGHHFTTIIAVVKKSFFEKDDVLIALLDAGVNRCIAETTNISICNIEIKQILHSIVRPHNVMSTQQALYTALHRLKEVLIISDDVLRIQYANKSAERLLNMRLDEIISKPLADIFVSDVSSISAHGKSIREFDGILTVRRKSQDGIPMHVRVVPVACIGRTPTHFVFNFDVPGGQTDFIATLPQPKEAPRGSLHSIRRGSFDVRSVASDGLRRTSLAKLTSLPLEAPITKIINLLSQVQETSSADEARLIDKVLEFLKREGLYSPQMKELRPDDPIATDLIGALLTGPSLYSSRRSSNDSIIRVSNRPSGLLPAKMKATPLIMEQLEESLSWEFDIFKLEETTEKRPLLYLGMEMFRRFDMFATFNIDENVCKSWLAVIEANYHAQNTYHNSTHAADVMQATGAFITQLAVKDMVMDRMDEATALIAAAAHDIDHPGRSSAFLCNSNSPLAILYNDLTVLESHHAAITFKLTLGDDKINIFKNLEKETYKSVRSTIIDMILATEMTRHFEHLAKFVSVFGTDVEPRDIVQNEEESQILIRRMLIKVADVSNPARPPVYCVEWARRIAEEYFTQTDEEKAKALPIVMPMFDRGTCSIPKSQIGFIEYIIQDMMHAWDSFIDMPQLITYMQMNYAQWKKFEEQGIHTLADIKTKQVTLSAKKSTCK